jgi:hypothetical protein
MCFSHCFVQIWTSIVGIIGSLPLSKFSFSGGPVVWCCALILLAKRVNMLPGLDCVLSQRISAFGGLI